MIVIAEKQELKLVKQLGYENEPVIITGVGAINVINALKDLPKDTEIINIGYAGSLYFPIGTVVQISDVNTYHEIANFKEYHKVLNINIKEKYNYVGKCYTSTDFVLKTNTKEPCVFDMELAYIASMFKNVRAIKVISDKLSYVEFKKKGDK